MHRFRLLRFVSGLAILSLIISGAVAAAPAHAQFPPTDNANLVQTPGYIDCYFTPTTTMIGYNTFNAVNASFRAVVRAGVTYPVAAVNAGRVLIQIRVSVSVWVNGSLGTFSGGCLTQAPPDPHPTTITALVTVNARLWTAPNVHQGQVIVSLQAGTAVTVLRGPVSGPIQFSTGAVGDWYLVRPFDTEILGWIWVGRLQF
ncbi:MAG: hypothetical protein GYB67_09495 [Chloroflexi bacterium]|nr:hypothetical protein [Chloroflexota bacterium]